MFNKFIENFLTIDECDYLISLGKSMELKKMQSAIVKNGKLVEDFIEYSGNKRTGGYFTNELLDNPIVKSMSNNIILLSNALKPCKGIDYTKIKYYSFNRYTSGDFLDWHADSHEILEGATITFILQLNDNYDGGDVKYIINEIEYKLPKKIGSVFVFDSQIQHSVSNVESGFRYSLNVWPSSKKIISLL
jgi:predicted 2-oxoglutarate/Fe(II)-dependent dioxygenase YbiX